MSTGRKVTISEKHLIPKTEKLDVIEIYEIKRKRKRENK